MSEATFNQSAIAVSKRENGKNVFDRFLPIFVPYLSDVSDDFPAPDKIEERQLKEGDAEAVAYDPVYNDQRLQFLQECLSQRVENLARSKAKAGGEIADNWTALLESGGAKYPVVLKAFREKLEAFLQGTSMSEAAQAKVKGYTAHNLLAEASPEVKEKVAKVFSAFASALGEDAAEYSSIFAKLNEALETEEQDLEFDL